MPQAASWPKYALVEIERRWLVNPAYLETLNKQLYRDIEDIYFPDTQLRLRKMASPEGNIIYKLCKKYGKTDLSEPITNLYLSETEYCLLAKINGTICHKHRYALAEGSIDHYIEHPALAIFEVEFQSIEDAQRYTPPPFVGEEITHNLTYSGASLSK